MYSPFEKTIKELARDLREGKVTAKELTMAYLDRIARFDGALNSVLEINPDALFAAEKCDVMLNEGTDEGLLMGIPILIKDNIDTGDKMHTSAGSLALKDNFAPADSGVADMLRHSGAIILGKTNMTEFANFMTDGMPSGYSSRGGQVINPYIRELTPSGSSSGSGVAAACSFAAACIGTETNGSIISPSKNNCIVGIKPTVGLVSRRGIIPISHTQDTAGPMARCVEDAAILLTAIAGMDHEGEESTLTIPESSMEVNYLDYVKMSAEGMRIGYIERENMTETEKESLKIAIDALTEAGCTMVKVDTGFKSNPMHNKAVMLHEFKSGINAYLSKAGSKMKTLADIIEYNRNHSKECLKYGQTLLEGSENLSGRLKEREYLSALLDNMVSAGGAIDRVIEENDLDLFIQTHYDSIHAVSGYPCITVPTGLPDRRSGKSVFFIGKKWSEGQLIRAAAAFEKHSGKRQPPVLYSFEKAEMSDFDGIWRVFEQNIRGGDNDWDESYPTKELVMHDLEKGYVHILKAEDGSVISAITINPEEGFENEAFSWSKGKSAGLSRLCIDYAQKGRGLGVYMLEKCCETAKENGFEYVRLWASKSNPKAMRLYEKSCWKCTGEANIYDTDFKAFERKL